MKQRDYYSPSRGRPKCAEPEFRFNSFVSEKQRVQESIRNTSILDTVPTLKKRLTFRDRIKEKDISPAFRYQASNNTERVIDNIRKSAIAQLQTPVIFEEIRCEFVNIK